MKDHDTRSRDIHLKHLNHLAVIARDVAPIQSAKIAAMLVHRNEIIGIGTNHMKSHPLAARYAKHPEAIYLHAEVDCIKNSIKHHSSVLHKSTLYICRVKFLDAGKSGVTWGLSKPCGDTHSGCTSAIINFEIPRVVYSGEGVGVYHEM